MRGCVVSGCTDVGACCHSVVLLGGLLGPDTSSRLDLVEALVEVRDLTYEELKDRYTFKAGEVWTAGGGYVRIMIRDHYPALFRSMCKNANVDTIGHDTPWAGPFHCGHALLRGTAGTGKTAFMFVMFIEFLKMLRASPREEVVKADGVVVFNPAVAGIVIQWDGVYGGNHIVFGDPLDFRCCVRLFDAGSDPPVQRLPGSRGGGYYLATSCGDPKHYKDWDSKARGLKRQYSVLWSVKELLQLVEHLGFADEISAQQVHDRYAVVGGVPRLILGHSACQLLTRVRSRVAAITMDMARAVMRNDVGKWEALMRADSAANALHMFAMDVKAGGDFDDVRVCNRGAASEVLNWHSILSAGPLGTCR